MSKPRIIVGMSGGVDSSVAAMLLLEQGYQVEGLFMKNWEDDDDDDYCAAAVDLADAKSVCDTLNIKLHSVNFAAEYWDRVFAHFLDEYRAGRTPNPDILCNKEIKFRAFLEYAQHLGANKIATGHYAQVNHSNNRYQLLRGVDTDKDQSYFLYTLNQSQLQHALFPLGRYRKPEIRNMAAERGLTTHDKKDSTGICFIGERRFDTFLQQYLPANPGDIETTDGEIIGRHNGLMYYTLGQRKGIGIGGLKQAGEQPWYVVDKDVTRNVLVVGQGRQHPRLYHTELTCNQLHWVSGEAPASANCSAKIRYRQPDQACQITIIGDDSARVVFDEAQRAITPGQSVVFYQDEVCLGGGVITAMSQP